MSAGVEQGGGGTAGQGLLFLCPQLSRRSGPSLSLPLPPSPGMRRSRERVWVGRLVLAAPALRGLDECGAGSMTDREPVSSSPARWAGPVSCPSERQVDRRAGVTPGSPSETQIHGAREAEESDEGRNSPASSVSSRRDEVHQPSSDDET